MPPYNLLYSATKRSRLVCDSLNQPRATSFSLLPPKTTIEGWELSRRACSCTSSVTSWRNSESLGYMAHANSSSCHRRIPSSSAKSYKSSGWLVPPPHTRSMFMLLSAATLSMYALSERVTWEEKTLSGMKLADGGGGTGRVSDDVHCTIGYNMAYDAQTHTHIHTHTHTRTHTYLHACRWAGC